jgi:hypothetical protein
LPFDMSFDAHSARALSRRMHSLHECLAVMKRSVVQAAQAGEFEVTVGLSESLAVVAGQSTNNAAYLIDLLTRTGHVAWSEAVTQAVRAGYSVRPAWGRVDGAAALEGLTLAWRSVLPDDAPPGAAVPLLMPAGHALAISQAEQAHVRWVEAQRAAIRLAAQQGKLSVSLDDPTPLDAPAWTKRREILQRAGFTTELIAREIGATLIVGW